MHHPQGLVHGGFSHWVAGEVCRMSEVPMGQPMGSEDKVSQEAHGSDGVCKVICGIHGPLMSSNPWLLCSLPFPTPQP